MDIRKAGGTVLNRAWRPGAYLDLFELNPKSSFLRSNVNLVLPRQPSDREGYQVTLSLHLFLQFGHRQGATRESVPNLSCSCAQLILEINPSRHCYLCTIRSVRSLSC